jgi:hypothetical protein
MSTSTYKNNNSIMSNVSSSIPTSISKLDKNISIPDLVDDMSVQQEQFDRKETSMLLSHLPLNHHFKQIEIRNIHKALGNLIINNISFVLKISCLKLKNYYKL